MNKGIFKFQVFRRRRAACKVVATISAFAMLCVASLPAFAGESYLGGNAVLDKLSNVTMSGNSADSLTFESASPVGVLDWTKFNIGVNQSMSFNGAASTFFNLVDGAAGKSQINGMINGSAGGVWVINPSGVAFGANAIVNLEGVFAAAAGTVNNADELRAGTATAPTFGSFGGAVDVGASTFTADRIALLGKSVSVDGANFKSVGSVSIGAADKMAVVDDVAGGKVTINISDFTDDTDVLKDIAVDLGDVDFGDTGHAGDLTVVTEGSISVKGAVKAEGDIVFKTLAAEGASAPVISYKQMSVASGKLLQGKSASATAAGRVAVDGEVTATGGDIEVTAGSYVNVGTAATVESKTGDVTINAVGNVNMDGSVTAVDSLTMTSKGIISADGVVKVTSESAKVTFGAEGGEIALSNEGNAIKGTVDVTGGNVDIKGDGNDFDYGKVAADGSGNITLQGNGKDVTIKDSVEASGTFTVNDAEDIALKDDVQVGAAVLTASKTIEQDTGKKLEAKGGITLTAGEGVTLKGSVNADTDGENGGDLVVMKNDTDNGDLLQDGGEIRANELTAAEFTQTGDGKLYANVINADVEQNGCEIVDNGDKTITVNGDFTQTDGTLGASDTVQITINGALEQNAVNSDPNRALIQADEVILNDAATQGGELAGDTIKAMTLTVNAEGKDISLASAANEVGALQGKGDDVSVTTSTALDLGALEAESLTVRAGGNVSQPGSAVVEGLVDITAEYSDGSKANVALLGTENQFGSVKVKGDKIEIKEKDDVVIAGIDGSILYVEAGPSGDPVEYTKTITQNETGDIKTSDGARFYGSSVKLDNDGNAIGPRLSARADDGDVEIVNNGPISIEDDSGYTDVKGVTASGVVKLTAKAGDITMFNAAELSGTSMDVVAEDGNILLNKGKVLVTAADGAATLSAENGAISAQNADNDFKSVTATAKSVTLSDKDDVTLTAVTATAGDAAVAAGGKTTVSGAVSATGAATVDAGGSVTVLGSVSGKTVALTAGKTDAAMSVKVSGAAASVSGTDSVTMAGGKSVQVLLGAKVESDGTVGATAAEYIAVNGEVSGKAGVTLETTTESALTDAVGDFDAGDPAGIILLGGTVASSDGAATLTSKGSVMVDGASSVSGKSVAVTANGEGDGQGVAVADGGTVTASDGTLEVTAKGKGGIQATGALVADKGAATLSAANGAIDAQNEANDFSTVTATATSVTLNDKNDITLTEVTATDTTDGDVRVRAATGSLTVADATSAKVSGQDIRLEAAEGAITVGAGVSGKNVTLSAKGDVTTKKEDSVADGALTAAGTGSDLLVESTEGNIELAADATAADTVALLADNGGIHAANVDATAIYAKGKDDVDIDNATGNLITKTGGNVDVEFTDSADHTISYDAEGYVKVSAKGKLTVDSAIAEGEDLKVTEVLWPEDTADKTLIDHENESTQVGGVRAGTSVELESTESGIKVNTAVAAGTTAELKAKTNVEVYGAVVGETGVTLTATDGDITIGSDTAPGAVVKAGNFTVDADGNVDETAADYTVGNLTMKAGDGVTVQGAAKVGASGTADIDAGAGGVTVDGSQLVANEAMTIDAEAGAVTIKGGSFVGGNSTVAVGMNKTGTDGTASLTVGDAADANGSQLVARDNLTAKTTGAILAQKGAKVGSDADVTLEGASVTAQTGAKVLAAGDVDIDATGAVTVDAATVAAKGDVLVGEDTDGKRSGSFAAQNGAAVTAEKSVAVYVSGDVTVENETTGERTEIAGKEGVSIDASGDVVIDGAIDTVTIRAGILDEDEGKNIEISAGKDVTVKNRVKVIAVGKVDIDAGTGGEGGNVTVEGNNVALDLLLAAKEDMTIDAKGGNVIMKNQAGVGGASAVVVGGDGTTKDVELSGGAAIAATGGEVSITAKGNVAVDNSSAVGSTEDNLTIVADGTTGIKADGRLIADADGKTTTLTAVNGAIDAQNAKNDFASVTATAKNGITLNDKDDVTLTEVKSTEGDLRVRAMTGDLTVVDATTGKVTAEDGDIRLEATEGAITVGAGVSGRNVTLKAGTTVETRKVDETADGALTATGGDLYINAGGDVTLAAAQTAAEGGDPSDGGVMAVVSGGKIEATGATTAKTLYTKDVDGVSFESVSADGAAAKSGKDMSFKFTKDVEVAYESTGGKVDVESTDSITVKSATVADEDLAVTEVKWPTGTEEVTLIDHADPASQIDGVKAATTASVKVTGDDKDITVETHVIGGEGVSLTAEKGNVKIGTDTAAGAIVKAGKFDIPTDGSAPVIADGDLADMTVTAGKDVTVQNGAKILAANDIDIDATGAVTVDNAKITAKGDVLVGEEGNRSGSLTAQNGARVTAGKSVAVYVSGDAVVENEPTGERTEIAGKEGVSLDASGDVTLDGSLVMTGEVDVEQGLIVGDAADIKVSAGKNVTLKNGGRIVSVGKMDVDAGTVVEGGSVTVEGVSQSYASELYSMDNMTIDANGGAVTVKGKVEEKRSTVFSHKTLDIGKDGNTSSVSVQDGARAVSDESLTVVSKGDITITGENTYVRAGRFSVDGETSAITIPEGAAVADMTVTADGSVTIRDGAWVDASGSATVTAKGDDGVKIDDATLLVDKGLTVEAKTGDGNVVIRNDAYVTAWNNKAGEEDTSTVVKSENGSVTVSDADVWAGGDLTLSGKTGVTIDTAYAGSDADVKIEGSSVTVDNATVAGETGVTIDAQGDIDVKGNVAFVRTGVFNEETGKVSGDGAKITISAGKDVTVENGVKVVAAGDVDVDAGKVAAEGGNVTVEGGSRIVSKDVLTIDAKGGEVTVKDDSTVVASLKTIDIGKDETTSSVSVQDGARVIGGESVTVRAVGEKSVDGEGDLTVTGGNVEISDATVTAGTFGVNPTTGEVDESVDGYAEGDLSINADNSVFIGFGAQAGASGTVDVDAGQGGVDVVLGGRLVANKAMTIDAGTTITDGGGNETVYGGDVTAVLGSYVGSNSNVEIGADGTTKSVAIYNSTVAAKDSVSITATDAVIESGSNAKVASDKGLSLTTTGEDSEVAIQSGAKAYGKEGVTVVSKGDVTVDGENTLVKAGTFSVNEETGAVTIPDGAEIAGMTVTADGNIAITAGAQVGASDTLGITATAGDVTVEGEATVIAKNDITVAAVDSADTTDVVEGNVTIDASSVASTAGNVLVGNSTTRIDGDFAARNGAAVAAEKSVKVYASGDAKVLDATTSMTASGGDFVIDADKGVEVDDAVVSGNNARLEAKTGVVLSGTASVTTTGPVANEKGNLRIHAEDGGITLGAGTTVSTANNVTVLADNGDITQDTDITATAGTIDVEATNGSIVMADGTTSKTVQNGNIRYKTGTEIALSKIDAGTGSVTLDALGDLVTGSIESKVIADGLAVKANKVGKSNEKMQFSVSKLAVNSATDVYVDNDKSMTVIDAKGNDFKVNRVNADGTLGSAQSEDINGIVAQNGDVDLDVTSGILTIDTKVSAAKTANISGDGISFDEDGNVSGADVVLTANNGDITQDDATISATGGYVPETSVNAAVTATGKATLVAANGSIGSVQSGSADYVGVEAGSITANAANDVAIADPNGDGLVVDSDGITGGTAAAVYTAGTITGEGTISAPRLTVSAKSYENGIVKVNVGNTLTVNNFTGGMNPLLAIFEANGGNDRPNLENLPNKTIVFYNGRLLGGDIKIINTLGAIEAFPVQTPELKSEQGIFGNPVFLHDELDVANPLAVGAIDFLLLDIPRLTLSSDFPLEVEKQVAAAGLNPTTSYWFGQKSNETEEKEEDSDGKPSDVNGGDDTPTTENQTAMN